MKKSLCILLFLVMLGTGGIVLVGHSLNQSKTDVRVKEKVVYGDAKEAKGLVVTSWNFGAARTILWKTRCTLGEKNIEQAEFLTDFSVNSFESVLQDCERNNKEEYFYVNWGAEGGNRMAEKLEPLLQGSKFSVQSVKLKDYYEYYPVSVRFSLGNVVMDGTVPLSEKNREMVSQLEQDIASYFHMEIYEDTMVIRKSKDEQGNTVAEDISGKGTLSEVFPVDTMASSNAAWFVFSNNSNGLAEKYVKNLPEGAGVYMLPYTLEGDEIHFQTENIRHVMDFSENMRFQDYAVDEKAHRIIMRTEKHGKQYLTILSCDTGEKIQEIPLGWEKEEGIELSCEDDVVLLRSDNRFMVLEESQGQYERKLDVDSTERYRETEDEPVSAAWRDGKLAVLTDTMKGVYYIFVYDKSGLVYEGKYRESIALKENWKVDSEGALQYSGNLDRKIQW